MNNTTQALTNYQILFLIGGLLTSTVALLPTAHASDINPTKEQMVLALAETPGRDSAIAPLLARSVSTFLKSSGNALTSPTKIVTTNTKWSSITNIISSYTATALSQGDTAHITDVDDLYFEPSESVTENKTNIDELCVFSSTGAYNLIFSTVNGSFTLKSSTTSSYIPYTLDWITRSTLPLSYHKPLIGLLSGSMNQLCDESAKVHIKMTISPKAFNLAEPGEYKDTLTILFQPE